MTNTQLTLFPDIDERATFFTILNVEDIDQNSLFHDIVRFRTKVIIDLRMRSVFDEPKFEHATVTDYLTVNNIEYLQFPLLINKYRRGQNLFSELMRRRYLLHSSNSGLIIGLTDSNPFSEKMKIELRNVVHQFKQPFIEVLPSVASRM